MKTANFILHVYLEPQFDMNQKLPIVVVRITIFFGSLVSAIAVFVLKGTLNINQPTNLFGSLIALIPSDFFQGL